MNEPTDIFEVGFFIDEEDVLVMEAVVDFFYMVDHFVKPRLELVVNNGRTKYEK